MPDRHADAAAVPVPDARDDRERGVYNKYRVERLRDETGKHDDCWYFVLDIRHDEHARVALKAYAESCSRDYPQLGRDLGVYVFTTRYEGGPDA